MPPQSGAPAGLYVHVPFCSSKCLYCDFYSVTDAGLRVGFIDALAREAELYSAEWGGFDSLYIGGGTPSILDVKALEGLFESMRGSFRFSDDTQVTFEANPCDVTRDRLLALKDLGVNRLSVGIQSFDDPVLAALGRRHTGNHAVSAILACRSARIEQLSLDLIYGLPGQTLEVWQDTLRRALSYKPEHLSCYALSIEEGTPFFERQQRGALDLPSEDLVAEMFAEASDRLDAAGYDHYEVSNYARGAAAHSRHNEKYWTGAPYLGLGPAAHSFDGVRRWWNVRDVRGYASSCRRGERPLLDEETLTDEQRRLERLSLGLRTREGVPNHLAEATPEGRTALADFRAAKWLVRDGDHHRTTRLGLRFADAMARRFA